MPRTWLLSVLSLAVFLVGIYLFFVYALPLVLPFAVALITAELIEPLVARLTFKGRLPRAVTVATVMFFMIGLIITIVTVAMARLIVETQDAISALPYLYAAGLDITARFSEQFGAFHASVPASIQDTLTRNLAVLQETVSHLLPSLQTTIGVFSGLPGFLTNLLIAMLATFFISRDRRQIFDFLLSLFPAVWQKQVRQVKLRVWSSAMGFVKAQLFLILLTMIQAIIGLLLIGSNYSVLVGILIGVADLLPMLGPASIFLPWIAYSFLFGHLLFGIKLTILYALVAGVRAVLEPKVVGEQIGLHPLTILFSVYVGFHFFGAAGFVLGPLLAIFLKAMIQSGLLPALQEIPKE